MRRTLFFLTSALAACGSDGSQDCQRNKCAVPPALLLMIRNATTGAPLRDAIVSTANVPDLIAAEATRYATSSWCELHKDKVTCSHAILQPPAVDRSQPVTAHYLASSTFKVELTISCPGFASLPLSATFHVDPCGNPAPQMFEVLLAPSPGQLAGSATPTAIAISCE